MHMAHAMVSKSNKFVSAKFSQQLQRQIVHKFKITSKPSNSPKFHVNRLNLSHVPIRKLTKSVAIPQHSNVHSRIYYALAQNTSKQHGVFKLAAQAYARKWYHHMNFAMNAVDGVFKKHPLLAGATVACTKAVLADIFAQIVIEKAQMSDLNLKRVGLFAALGIFYNGLCVYGIYAKIYPLIFDQFQHWGMFTRSITQSSIDVLAHATLVYFPTFYALKSCIFNGFSVENVTKGVTTYFYENIWDDFQSTLKVWFPCTLISFGYVPPYLRTPYMSMVSFIWVVLLSTRRGSEHCDNTTK